MDFFPRTEPHGRSCARSHDDGGLQRQKRGREEGERAEIPATHAPSTFRRVGGLTRSRLEDKARIGRARRDKCTGGGGGRRLHARDQSLITPAEVYY